VARRGPRNILDFETTSGPRSLEQNYRSTQVILDAASA
jgi:superfamily I DNA/RNA helicase